MDQPHDQNSSGDSGSFRNLVDHTDVADEILDHNSADHAPEPRSDRGGENPVGRGEIDLEMLKKALGATASGILITDARRKDNPIIFANPAFTNMTGYGMEEVIGKNCRFLQGKETDRGTVQMLHRTIHSGEGSKSVLLNYRKDGTPFWNELVISPVYDGGEVTHFIGIQSDVSDREEQIHLQDALDFAESIYETVREPLVILDENLCIVRVNQAFHRLFGPIGEDAIGRAIYDLGGGQWNIPSLRELLEKILPEQNPFEGYVIEHEFHNIGARILELNARRLQRDGFPEYILLAINDVTEQRQNEAELERRVEELDDRDRAKDEFLAMLSHELRNPLNAISGAIYLASEHGEGNEDLELPLEIATRQIQQMSSLINDLLEVSRITQGKVELKRQRFRLDELVAATVAGANAKLAADDVRKVRTQLDPNVVIEGDPIRIEQVLFNLINNAIKFSPKGSVRVELENEGEWAEVRVIDQGVGIDPDFLPHIFDLFRQSKRSLARSEGGLGIGLTISKQLVSLHGGEITARSEGAGRGTTFIMRLPKGSTASTEAPTPSAPAPEVAAKRPLRAIVVDDNRDGANVLAKLIKRHGFDVRTLYDGFDLGAEIDEFRPELIFLDIGLPGKDGYQLAQEVRSNAALNDTYLVALTGYGQEEDRAKSRDAGFDLHLLKPLSITTLKDVLARVREANE